MRNAASSLSPRTTILTLRSMTASLLPALRRSATLLALLGGFITACRAAPLPSTEGSSAPQSPSEYGVTLELVAAGLRLPTAMIEVDGRFLVAELAGTISYVGDSDPVLDLSDRIAEIENEQGLLSIAIHPNYPADLRLFVSYTRADDASVVESYDLPADGSAVSSRPRHVIVVPQKDTFHLGGHLAFGPDGYLYFGLGDGGGGSDRGARGQNPHSLARLNTAIGCLPGTIVSGACRQPIRRGWGGRRGLGLRPPESVAFQLRPSDGRPVDRRRRRGGA